MLVSGGGGGSCFLGCAHVRVSVCAHVGAHVCVHMCVCVCVYVRACVVQVFNIFSLFSVTSFKD